MTRLLIVALTAVLALPGATWLLTRCAAADDTAEPPGYVVLPSVYDRPGYAAGAASAASLASTPIDTTAGRTTPTMAPSSSTASAADPAATTTATTGARR